MEHMPMLCMQTGQEQQTSTQNELSPDACSFSRGLPDIAAANFGMHAHAHAQEQSSTARLDELACKLRSCSICMQGRPTWAHNQGAPLTLRA